MAKFRKINYKVYHHDNEVIAVSTFARRPVKGIAKCDPRDEFNSAKGEELAIARCDVKVAKKRAKCADEQVKFYAELLQQITKDYVDAMDYNRTAERELAEATERLSKIEASM